MTGELSPTRIVGRYALYDQIGAGGMATVHFGRLIGPAGFSKTVAIKRLHPHFARDPEFASMFLDEARLAARIHHPNVVATIDVVAKDGELFLVMEFIEGLSLSGLFWEAVGVGDRIPIRIVGAIMTNVLAGLHAAHEAKSERGEPLNLIHRDVSPQNVLVGRDGIARVLDFGIAKAIGRSHTTREGRIKGKLAYMPPEQVRGKELDRRVDIYAASVMLWELLTMRRLYDEDDDAALVYRAVNEEAQKPSEFAPNLPVGTDELVLRGLAKNRDERFATARDMAKEVQRILGTDTAMEVGDYVNRAGKDTLLKMSSKVREIESDSREIATDAVVDPSSNAPTLPILPDLGSLGPPKAAEVRGRSTAPTALIEAPESAGVDTTLPAPADASSGPAPAGKTAAEYFGLDLDVPAPKPSAPNAIPATHASAPAKLPPKREDTESSGGGGLDIDLDVPARPARGGGAFAPGGPHGGAAALPKGFSREPPMARPHVAPQSTSSASSAVFLGVGILVVGAVAVGGYSYFGKTPVPTASAAPVGAAPPPGGLERSCEVGRKRILTGGENVGTSDTYGWAVELWLAREDKPLLDSTNPGIAGLRGSDGTLAGDYDLKLGPNEHGEVTIATLESPPPRAGTEPGVVVRFTGAYAEKFFSDNTRGAFIGVAESAYRKSGATIAALYAKCAHLPYHDVGAWFKGNDLSAVADSVGFLFAGYNEAPWISRSVFEPRGHATNSFEAYQARRLGIDSDAFTEQLKLLGANVDDKKESATVIFSAANPTRAISASRWVTTHAGLQ